MEIQPSVNAAQVLKPKKRLPLDHTPECSLLGEEPDQCRSAQLGKGSASALMRFGSTSATPCCRDPLDHKEVSGSTARTMSRRWLLSVAYRVWDSNSARSEGS